ncbi:MAG: ATP-binding protein [Planctomycetaceae bacterium]
MSLASDRRDSLVRYTSRLADKLHGLRPGEHRVLAAQMLKGIGKRCEVDHAHLYLSRLKEGPQLSLFAEWSRTSAPSLSSKLQRVALGLVGGEAAELLPAGTAVYCAMNGQAEACSRLVTGILRELKCAAYEMIPIRISKRLRGVIAVGHDRGPSHLDSACQHLVQLTGHVFIGSYRAACRESIRARNHRQWRNVANGSCDFALVLDSALEIMKVVPFRNQEPPAITGLRLQDIVTRNLYEPVQRMVADAIKSGTARTCDFLTLQEIGKQHSFNCRIEPGGDTAESACTLYLANNDAERAAADELIQMREQLAQASRLSISGNLSSELAHQLTQPLQVIEYQAFTLKNRLKNGEASVQQMLQNIAAIEASVDLASEVIFNLRDFLHDRRARLGATDLGRMINHATQLVQPRPDSVAVRITIDDELGLLKQDPPLEVHVDRVQTTYVLINLLVNAIEACTQAQTAEPEVRIQLQRHPSKPYVVLSVIDNGPGLPAGDTEAVFKRFFTTKKKGFGFGLAICRDVIDRQRGQIHAQNNPTAGCSFTFCMLVQSEEAEEETRLRENAADQMLDEETTR